ncbi:hypothetical protein CLAFUR4_10137 [Fulvia fulva]|nr:hypothetical protein CLAFUR4_10137 [Fulvia fulva]KAK4616692.1 hypothetical protein CLAFUR0_10135 [Fulvia fulva]WPV33809.1 hypothetical protein CLAFUW7_10134 [Fulvia fulva]
MAKYASAWGQSMPVGRRRESMRRPVDVPAHEDFTSTAPGKQSFKDFNTTPWGNPNIFNPITNDLHDRIFSRAAARPTVPDPLMQQSAPMEWDTVWGSSLQREAYPASNETEFLPEPSRLSSGASPPGPADSERVAEMPYTGVKRNYINPAAYELK